MRARRKIHGWSRKFFAPARNRMPASNRTPPWRASMRSEEHTSELQSHRDLHSFPTRRSSDLDARTAQNPWLVEEVFRTGTQSHACLEPHATVARFDGDRLTLHVSTQSVFHVMKLIAKRYKLEHDKVRVIADHVGGGFGSKGALGIETTAAIDLAREAKAPVRIAY